MDSPGRKASPECVTHNPCAAPRAMVTPPVVMLTYECFRSLTSEGDGGGARGEQRTQRRRRLAASTRFATRVQAQHVARCMSERWGYTPIRSTGVGWADELVFLRSRARTPTR